jgi:hypothetical protein
MVLMAMGAGRHQSCQSTRSTVMNGMVQDAVPQKSHHHARYQSARHIK